MACLQPAYDYFTSKFLNGDQLQPAVEIFKAARLFNPVTIAEIPPTAAILRDQLRKVHFLMHALMASKGNYQLTLLLLLMSILILML